MKLTAFSLLVMIFPVFSTADLAWDNFNRHRFASPAGLILPRPKVREADNKKPVPLTIRIVNRGEQTVYLHGIREVSEEGKVQLYFYHQGRGQGWKPYFDSQPCNLPSCRNFYSVNGGCGKGRSVVIRLGPQGTYNAVKEFRWGGLLYQRNEATREGRQKRYCYKGWAPSAGKVRVEVEYSERVSRDDERKETMAGRDHRAIEFNLPARKNTYEIVLGG